MIDKVFFQILNMSFASSFAIIFVLFARLILKKVPKVFSYTLWSVVLFRLICPVSFESTFSLLPINVAPVPIATIYSESPQISTGITAFLLQDDEQCPWCKHKNSSKKNSQQVNAFHKITSCNKN